MIGSFGNIVFETSDKRIYNFSGFTRETGGRFAAHEVIGKKPQSEFIGPGLDNISFTVNINGMYGMSPRKEMDRWCELANKGEAYTLVIGDKALGTDKWVVKTISEAWNTILNNGKLISGKIDISLEEYISHSKLSIVKIAREIKPKKSTNIKEGYVTATFLNVRNGPSTKNKIIGMLAKDDKVKILSSGSWYKIQYKGSDAYVYSRYIWLG